MVVFILNLGFPFNKQKRATLEKHSQNCQLARIPFRGFHKEALRQPTAMFTPRPWMGRDKFGPHETGSIYEPFGHGPFLEAHLVQSPEVIGDEAEDIIDHLMARGSQTPSPRETFPGGKKPAALAKLLFFPRGSNRQPSRGGYFVFCLCGLYIRGSEVFELFVGGLG